MHLLRTVRRAMDRAMDRAMERAVVRGAMRVVVPAVADEAAPRADRVADALTLAPGWRTRFAPAPTGYLHLGHVVNAIHVWGMARAHDGRVVLRIEDHDRARCRDEYERALLDDLDWLGFVPDVASTAEFRNGESEHRQSDNEWRYAAAITALELRGRVYACRCSRGDIARLVPDVEYEEMRYPGTCRGAGIAPDESMQRRVILDDEPERFFDLRLGPQEQHPARQCGDLLVRDRLGHWTYQFAVTVDDLEDKIDVVIRGEDLLSSTGRQRALARLLGRKRSAHFLHHPLLRKPDGAKLSKSAGDSCVRELRAAGLTAAEVIGRAAQAVGLTDGGALEASDVGRFFA
jgi:glutamyl-tRNA synthetase/glutamyl-Q tRNA(Asp) synthetase